MAELGALLGGRYRLDQVLGQGGMATIFRATDDKLGREVAVKVLRPEYGSDAQFVERFEHEAQAAASLSHPNIVQVYDFGNDPAGPYIVMEQVAGGDLSAVLGERGSLPPTAVARTGQQVADALAAAHARGLVHRDIKPSNILLSPDGRVQVADFGIAQAAAGSPVTATGITLGSVLYFSPEQARGDTATAASDIYSLGLVMYEMLTGQRAYSGDSPAAVAVARLSGGVPSPMAVRADVPPSLDSIVRWCLAVDPRARPSASELSAALARFITDPSGAAAYASAAGVPAVASVTVPSGPATDGGSAPTTQTVLVATAATANEAERSGSGPWAWLAVGLGLLVIIASGILLFLLFSGIGDEGASPSPSPSPEAAMVATPDFVGQREGPAARTAENNGLVLEVEYVETDESEPGRIIEQLPEAGVEIPEGTSVQVSVTTQIETVVVPDVHGIKEDKAIEQLEAAGLHDGDRATSEDQLPQGYVVETDPRAGATVRRGSAVDYVISSGPGAETTAGPGVTASPTDTPTRPPRPSSAPTAFPSPFPSQELALVGDFGCLDLGTARSHLDAAGLLVGATIPDDPPPEDNWLVHEQLPEAGASVRPLTFGWSIRKSRVRRVDDAVRGPLTDMSIFDHPDHVAPAPTWRCPHCRTLQPETARCRTCQRAAVACSTCDLYRASVAGDMGYCAADPARAPLSGEEVRSCWTTAAAVASDEGLGLFGQPDPTVLVEMNTADAVSVPRRAPAQDRAPAPPAVSDARMGKLTEAPHVEPGRSVISELERRARRSRS